jgi:hypothetical protein
MFNARRVRQFTVYLQTGVRGDQALAFIPVATGQEITPSMGY